jgi:hypothetical protein
MYPLLLNGIAVGGVRHFSAARHDLDSLQLPGRAFYLRNNAATAISESNRNSVEPMAPLPFPGPSLLQRVQRGNWKEDMLWRLHEVVVAPGMIQHHTLGEYIRALAAA